MDKHRTYFPKDEAPLAPAGDLAFRGVDMRAPPLVPEGYVSGATNLRLLDGVYETRPGLFSPEWGRYASTEFPYRGSKLRSDDAAWLAAYATTYGAGVYSEPAGETWIVRVAATALLFFREMEIGRIVPLNPGLAVTGPVTVYQNFNELRIVRGEPESSLTWAGNWALPVVELVADTIPPGYAATPAAHYGLAWRERDVFLADNDDLILTRIADGTQYDTTAGIYYINRGRGDRTRAAVPIGGASLLILKSRSLHLFTAVQGDLSDARVDEQPVEMQFDSPRTAIAVDGKVWWLDRRGVRTAEIAAIDADNKVLLKIDSSLSDRIVPLLRRIAWKYADQFTAAVTTDRIYFAVALDTQTTPQSLLVWNRVVSEWESLDQWDTATLGDFSVQTLLPAVPWLYEPRLFAVDPAGQVACLEFGRGEDHVGWEGAAPVRADIADELVSRGYTAGTNDPKKLKRAQFQLDTWNPGTIALEARFPGPGERADLGTLARDRTKYFTGAGDFGLTNYDGRFHDPFRQDYSVALGDFTPASGNPVWAIDVNYVIGNQVFRPTTGRNYTATANNTSAASNEPTARPDLWFDAGEITPSSPVYNYWQQDFGYVAGLSVYYAGRIYTCLQAHLSTNGNRPEDHREYWRDDGLDANLPGNGLFLRPALSRYHDSDADRDGSISDLEENYTRFLASGTGGAIQHDASVYTGFRRNGIPGIAPFHSADYNQSGTISAPELARVVALHDAGNYHVDPAGIDGFAPGVDPDHEGVRLEDFQSRTERLDIGREAAWCQLVVRGSQGARRIRSLSIETATGVRGNNL